MKIRHRLYVSAVVSTILIAVLLIFLFNFSYSMNKELKKSGIANSLVKETTNLLFLMDEYIISHEEENEKQWLQKYDSIKRFLAEIKSDPSFAAFPSEFEKLEDLFSRLKSLHGKMKHPITENTRGEAIVTDATIQAIPAFQIRLASQTILNSVFKIAQVTDSNIRDIQIHSNYIIITFALLFLVIIIIDSFLTIKRITRPLKALLKGVNRVNSGQMDYDVYIDRKRPNTLGNDEVSELASAFNSMMKRLNDSYENLREELKVRKLAEIERTRLQNYLKNIIDSMPSVLVGVDADGKVTQWNREAETVTGITAPEARGKILTDVFPHLSLEMERIRKTIKERRPHKEIKVENRKEGITSFSDITVYPLISDGIDGAVIRIDDVTERVRLEEMMIQTEKMMSVGGLAAGMAHEINNPLGIIMQGIQNTARRLSPDLEKNKLAAAECEVNLENLDAYLKKRNISEYLEGMREAAVRASKIVKNMLDFSRRSDSKMAPADIHQLLDGVLELAANDYDLKKKYDFRHIHIVKEYDPGIGYLRCTKTEIEQVILNLVKNAAQAMAEKKTENYIPQITIKTRKEKEYALIEIRDNGPGMAEKIRKRIFEPFFTTKDIGIGTGLGLSVSYFIITTNHQGKMSVETAPGKGAAFKIRLPLTMEES